MDMRSPGATCVEINCTRTLSLIGVATGIGCTLYMTCEAPAYLRNRGIIDRLGT